MGTMVTEAASAIWKNTSDNTAKGSCGAIKMVTAAGGRSESFGVNTCSIQEQYCPHCGSGAEGEKLC